MPEAKDILIELSKYHKEWLDIAFTFLQNKHDAEDLVQDFYLRLHKYKVKLDNVRYKNGINKYYMYLTIRNMSMDFLKSKTPTITLEGIEPDIEDNEDKQAEQKLYKKIDKKMNTWSQYDRILFECYMYSGLSYRQIANGTDKGARFISNQKFLSIQAVKRGNNISVSSMFNTIKSCRLKLQEELGQDFKHYFNNEFDKIL